MTEQSVFYAEIFAVLITAAHILGILNAIDALFRVRTSQGAIAWGISLVTFPYLAVPLYWVFGRPRFESFTDAVRDVVALHTGRLAQVHAALFNQRVVLPADCPVSERVLESLSPFPFSHGNSISLLVDGDATFQAIFSAIERAEHFVLVQFYIVRNDRLGNRLKDLLIRKANAGVAVYFLTDSIGSLHLDASYCEDLEASGVRTAFFRNSHRVKSRFQINFRNHRKVVVVDGHVGFVGGHNVGDEYVGQDPAVGRWRDTHVEIHGIGVLPLQVTFGADWFWASKEPIDISYETFPSQHGECALQIIPSSPADKLETAALLFHHLIASARTRLWIASPYFVPDEATTSALKLAALRGVDVRILIPDECDHLLVYFAAYAYLNELLEVGVKIFRYTDGFLHEKVTLVDDTVALVGTANLDNRSFRLNFEIGALVVDKPFCEKVHEMLSLDFRNSRPFEAKEYHGRWWGFKAAVKISRLLSPIL